MGRRAPRVLLFAQLAIAVSQKNGGFRVAATTQGPQWVSRVSRPAARLRGFVYVSSRAREVAVFRCTLIYPHEGLDDDEQDGVRIPWKQETSWESQFM